MRVYIAAVPARSRLPRHAERRIRVSPAARATGRLAPGQRAGIAVGQRVRSDRRPGLVSGRHLHPRRNSAADENLLLQYDLYQRIPTLQIEFDTAIERIRARLRKRVQAILDRLPEMQSLFCRWSSIETCMSDPLLVQVGIYGLNLRSQLKAVTSRHSQGPGRDDVSGGREKDRGHDHRDVSVQPHLGRARVAATHVRVALHTGADRRVVG